MGFNQLLSVSSTDGSSTTFAYDGNGNQVGKTDSGGLTQYVYDLDNRLRGVALAGGGGNAFEYDAKGLRTKKTDSGGTRSFLLDGLSVVAEYQGGSRSAFYTQSLARIDEVLSVVNSQGKYWYESDALGSTYALTSRGGAAVARTGYDAFGAITASLGSVSQPWGYTGRPHDPDFGGLDHRQREDFGAIGRWNRPDPTGMSEGPNRYAYVRDQPTRAVDPEGLTLYSFEASTESLLDENLTTVAVAIGSADIGAALDNLEAHHYNIPSVFWLVDAVVSFGVIKQPGLPRIRRGITVFPQTCPNGGQSRQHAGHPPGSVWSVIDKAAIAVSRKYLAAGMVVYDEEIVAHELGHAAGLAFWGYIADLGDDDQLSIGDELSCQQQWQAHVAMAGDPIRGALTWQGCSHMPGWPSSP
jgi:RHS repeat-associated protein